MKTSFVNCSRKERAGLRSLNLGSFAGWSSNRRKTERDAREERDGNVVKAVEGAKGSGSVADADDGSAGIDDDRDCASAAAAVAAAAVAVVVVVVVDDDDDSGGNADGNCASIVDGGSVATGGKTDAVDGDCGRCGGGNDAGEGCCC